MELTEKQLDLLKRKKIVALVTSSSDYKPRAIFVEVNKAEDDKIIVTDNEMETTRKNLLENKNVFLLAFEEDYHYGLKISGKAEYYIEGEYFDFVRNLETNKNYSPKGVVVVSIEKVTEFK
ncbi:MAG TPA: pyridoxamine 5'-phosphate oxidase family protein [Patescibacteria group bacterium]|nr:pyridoxamine 5'-phosphate oxidase family protein [Patescibacteria group bacterium]